jgi:hypothetical protein
MQKYTVIFSVAYVGISVLLGLIFYFINMNGGMQVIVGCLGAAFVTAHFFQKNENRAPTKAECTTLAWTGTVSIWVMSAIFFGLVWLFVFSGAEQYELQKMIMPVLRSNMIWFVVVIVTILSLVEFFAIRWAFGWFIKQITPKI